MKSKDFDSYGWCTNREIYFNFAQTFIETHKSDPDEETPDGRLAKSIPQY